MQELILTKGSQCGRTMDLVLQSTGQQMHCGNHAYLELQLPAVFPELFFLCQAPGLFLCCLLHLNHQSTFHNIIQEGSYCC